MMTNQEIIAIVTASMNGAEIECKAAYVIDSWDTLKHPNWNFDHFIYRVKPPATKKVKSVAYRNCVSGEIIWRNDGAGYGPSWQRFPTADLEGDVELAK